MPKEPKLSGTILPGVEPAKQDQLSPTPKAVSDQRKALFRQGIKRRAALGKALGVVQKSVDSALAEATIVAGRIDLATQEKILGSLNRQATEAMRKIGESIQGDVHRTMTRAMQAENNALRQLGLKPLSVQERGVIIDRQMEQWPVEQFPPGKGVNFNARLTKHVRLLVEKVRREITSPLGRGGLARLRRDVQLAINGKGFGSTPVEGGSTYKQSHRLMIAEQTRKANDASIELFREADVGFARWTLSSDHKWYGGAEICEILASQRSMDTVEELIRMGIDPSDMDLQGVYPLQQWPDYPHPFCKCGPWPFYVEPVRAASLGERTRVSPVKEVPKEVVPAQSVSVTDARQTAFTFNRVAADLGIPQVATPELVGTVGTVGLAAAYAASIRSAGKSVEESKRMQAQLQIRMARSEKELARLDEQRRLSLVALAALVVTEKVLSRSEKIEELHTKAAKERAQLLSLAALVDALESGETPPIFTVSLGSRKAVLKQLDSLGLFAEDVIIQNAKGRWWIKIKPSGVERLLVQYGLVTQEQE